MYLTKNPNKFEEILPHTIPENKVNNDNGDNHIPIASQKPDEEVMCNRDDVKYNV